MTLPGVDVAAVIQAQRVASVKALQDYTKSRRDTSASQRRADTAWLLVLDSLIFQTEAEVRWLDLCEARMAQLNGAGSARPAAHGDDARGPKFRRSTLPSDRSARRPAAPAAKSNIPVRGALGMVRIEGRSLLIGILEEETWAKCRMARLGRTDDDLELVPDP